MSSSKHHNPPLQQQNVSVPEMGRFQRQIVDNSLEEGQFQSGIDALDQLRSLDHKPSVIHILHLIYISFHPAHEISLNDDEPFDRTTLLLHSPRKIIKQTKAALILTPEAVLSARRLLLSFALTNTPEDIGAALPQYPETENAPPMQFEHMDSPIFKQSEAIKCAKNCWEILKSGYRLRKLRMYASPKGKGKQTRTSEPSFVTGDDGHEILPVDDDSWSTLNWLLTLFERDADLMEARGELRYSPLLVKQIPPPSRAITRWDTSEPLKLIFFAIQQEDPRKHRMGYRLLNLLIDLCHTPHLNLTFFASSVLSQLASSSDAISFSAAEIIPTFFSHLSSSPSVLPFKIILCKKMLQDIVDHSLSSDAPNPRAIARPKAQVRARPKALSRQRTHSDVGTLTSPPLSSVLSGASMGSIGSADTTNTTANKASSTLPPWDQITSLLLDGTNSSPASTKTSSARSMPIWATHSLILRVKFELLFAYGMAHIHNELESCDLESELEWNTSLKDGSLSRLVDVVFVARGSNDGEDALFYRSLLISALGLPQT